MATDQSNIVFKEEERVDGAIPQVHEQLAFTVAQYSDVTKAFAKHLGAIGKSMADIANDEPGEQAGEAKPAPDHADSPVRGHEECWLTLCKLNEDGTKVCLYRCVWVPN